MENLIVYPENQKQLNILKSLFEEMKIRFKSEEAVTELADWQKTLIDEGIKDFEEGRFNSREEVKIKVSEAAKKSILKGLDDVEKGNLMNEKEANQFFEDVINQMD